VPLDTHQVEPALELAIVPGDLQAGIQRRSLIPFDPAFNLLARPIDIAVAQQRHQVVGNRAGNCILEIEDARVVPRFVSRQYHQVARVVVAVYPDRRLLEGIGDQQLEYLLQFAPLFISQLETEMFLQQPVRKQHHFSSQQFPVIGWQEMGVARGAELQYRQRRQRIAVQAFDGLRVEFLQVGAVAEIAEQQEALFAVLFKHLGNIEADLAKTPGDAHERCCVFLRRRRIHDNQAGGAAANAEITTKAGISRCRFDLVHVLTELLKPIDQLLFALVHQRVHHGLLEGTDKLCNFSVSNQPIGAPALKPLHQILRRLLITAAVSTAILPGRAPLAAPVTSSGTCIVPPVAQNASPSTAQRPPDSDKVLITADSAEAIGTDTTIFRGNVRIVHHGRTVLADEARYHRPTARLQLTGNVRLESEGGNLFLTDHAELDTDLQTGSLQVGEFYFAANRSRGTANQTLFNQDKSVTLQSVKFTTCPADNESWSIFFKQLTLDRESDTGVGRNALLRIGKVPVFYTPYLRFPLGNRRQSGFLVPTFGDSDSTGTTVAIPYYFNLAPNYDATLTLRNLSKRGLQVGTEFRYLGTQHSGNLATQYLPGDSQTGTDRSYVLLNHTQRLSQNLSANLHAEGVSDINYFEDLGDASLTSNPTHLPRRLQLNYDQDKWHADALALDYQVLDASLATIYSPYRRIPQINLFTVPRVANNGFTSSVSAQYARFEHPVNESANRFLVDPVISIPFYRPWGYLTPSINGHLGAYQDRSSGSDTQITTAAFALDAGLLFERKRLARSGWTQTLEPRAFYVYSPYVDQSSLPLFDTAESEYSFDRLFRVNRFVGGDRIGDENRLTLALGSRWLDEQGAQRFHAGIGQSFYFADRRVSATLPASSPQTDTLSDTLLEASSTFTDHLYFRSTWSWNPTSGKTGIGRQFLQYQPGNDRIVSLGYRYQDLVGESTDLSAQWRLTPRWSLYSRLQYDLTTSTNLYSYAGFQYRSCCWSLQTLFSQRVDSSGKQLRAFQFQFNLTGLGASDLLADKSPLAQSVFFDH